MTFLVLPPHKAAGALRCNQRHIEVRPGLDETVVDGEAVREQEQGTLLDIIDHRFVECLLHHVRRQEHDHGRPLDGIRRLRDRESIGLCPGPARAARAQADHDVEAAVLEVQGVGTTLAAIAQHGNSCALQSVDIDIGF
jgi:hypothetical protein